MASRSLAHDLWLLAHGQGGWSDTGAASAIGSIGGGLRHGSSSHLVLAARGWSTAFTTGDFSDAGELQKDEEPNPEMMPKSDDPFKSDLPDAEKVDADSLKGPKRAPHIDHKLHAKEPPRRVTRVVNTPPRDRIPDERPPEEIEEEIRRAEHPEPRMPDIQKIEENKSFSVVRKEKRKEVYDLVSWKSLPAHGPCDPAEIFQLRGRYEQIKEAVGPRVCLDRYKELDNQLLGLLTDFDRGMPKCGNQYWVAMIRNKWIPAFTNCIKDECRAAPHLRPEQKVDINQKLRTASSDALRILIWPDGNVGPYPKQKQFKQKGLQGPEIVRTQDEPEAQLEAQLPPNASIIEPGKPPLPKPPPEFIDRPGFKRDKEPTPPRAPVFVNQAPVTAAMLWPGFSHCGVAARRRRAEGFLCDVRASRRSESYCTSSC